LGFIDPATAQGPASEREVIAIPECPVHSERVRAALRELTGLMPAGSALFPLHYVVVTGSFMTLVMKCAQKVCEDWSEAVEWGRLARHGISGVFLNFHPSSGNRIFSSSGWLRVWGEAWALDSRGRRYGPQGFQQLLPQLFEQALDLAEAFLKPEAGDSVLDLYCGSGASIERWVRRGAQVLGVEMGGESVECARVNAAGATVLQGRCSDRIPQMREQMIAWRADDTNHASKFVFMNPPRLGLEPEVLEFLAKEYRPARLAYLSCSAGTLARDLQQFSMRGYQVVSLHPFDFFPQTPHVETLVLVQSRK
jgi:tRNA/tmRNA/rRNA uracil-C5-methylase (TrmA/RlmC/RlmD family)